MYPHFWAAKVLSHQNTQHARVAKYIRRGQYLESYAYYNRYVLEPLINLLRLIHTPANANYYLIHISRHIPADKREKLEHFAQISSPADMEKRLPEAEVWFADLLAELEDKAL